VPLGTPTIDTASGVLAEAFGGKWGISYGHIEAKPDEIPIYIFCMDLQEPIKLSYAISLLHPLTGEQIRETSSIHTFSSGQHCGQRSLVSLTDLQEQAIYDRAKGLTTLLVRARLSTNDKIRESIPPTTRASTSSTSSGSPSPMFVPPLPPAIPVTQPTTSHSIEAESQEEAKRQARDRDLSRRALLQLHLLQLQQYQYLQRQQEYQPSQQMAQQLYPQSFNLSPSMHEPPPVMSNSLDLINSGSEPEQPESPFPEEDDEGEGTD